MRKEKCLPVEKGGATCLMCNTAPVQEVSDRDATLLKTAKENQVKKTSKKKKKKEENKLSQKGCSPREISILSCAALSNFKMSKKRRIALSARSGLRDPRSPQQDTNIWSELLGRHRGYTYSARVLSRILGLFRNATIQKHNPSEMQCYQKAMQILFAAEKENSYITIKNRRGTPSFPIVEEKNILFLCGRKMAENTQMKNHPFTHTHKHLFSVLV